MEELKEDLVAPLSAEGLLSKKIPGCSKAMQ
jgi:hypothetical protein